MHRDGCHSDYIKRTLVFWRGNIWWRGCGVCECICFWSGETLLLRIILLSIILYIWLNDCTLWVNESITLSDIYLIFWNITYYNYWLPVNTCTYYAASLIIFLRIWTRLLKLWVRQSSVITQYCISLNRRKNTSKLAVIWLKRWRPKVWYTNSYYTDKKRLMSLISATCVYYD